MNVEIVNKITQYSQTFFDVKSVEDCSYGYFQLVFESGDRSQQYNKTMYEWRKLNA